MYPPTSSSQPHKPAVPPPTGLTRYGSAPSSLLATAVDSVVGAGEREFLTGPSGLRPSPPSFNHSSGGGGGGGGGGGMYFSGDSSTITSESTRKVNSSSLLRSHGLNEIASRMGSSSASSSSSSTTTTSSPSGPGSVPALSSSASLLRQRSSPAGFFSHLSATDKNGFFVTRGTGSYGSQGGPGVSRLKSQLSFTGQESLSQISEVSESIVDGIGSENGHNGNMHSFVTTSFGMDSWDSNTTSIQFSAPSSKRAKNFDGDMYGLNALESQFSLPQTTLEMAAVEKLLHIPEDSVPCKIRAKRGCATHPRSIAERERRTRISGKLKKLQDLVPNMDKQTSYADMLDLAVQHIKGLQNQVQKLHKELENCSCGCKQTR